MTIKPKDLRDSLNTALQAKLNVNKPIIAAVQQTIYSQNYVLMTTNDYKAADILKHPEVLKQYFTYDTARIDAQWWKIVVHNVSITDFGNEKGMEHL